MPQITVAQNTHLIASPTHMASRILLIAVQNCRKDLDFLTSQTPHRVPGKLLRRERSLRRCHRPSLPKKNHLPMVSLQHSSQRVQLFFFKIEYRYTDALVHPHTHTDAQTTIPFCCARNSWEKLIGISSVARHDDNFMTCFALGSRRVLVAFFLWAADPQTCRTQLNPVSFFFCHFYFYMVRDEPNIMNKSPWQSNSVGGCVSLLLTFEFL